MEKTVQIPDGVDVHIDGMHIAVKGIKGELSRDFGDPRFNGLINIEKKDSVIHVSGKGSKIISAMVGTIAAHIRNMVAGAENGFRYDMKIMYTHFPMTVSVTGKEVQIKNFFGEKGLRIARIVGDTEVKIDKDAITLTGIDVEELGQTAANIERACKLTGRDRRIFQDGIFMTEKHVKAE